MSDGVSCAGSVRIGSALFLLLAACGQKSPDEPTSRPVSSSAPIAAAAVSAGAAPDPGAARYFGDVVLVNQDGERMHLYKDLIQGRTVVISTFFATCSGACPVISGTLAKLQDRVGDRLGKDTNILSITVDPENDTPEKLKEYAARFKAKRGWYFLTGSAEDVNGALKKLGQYVKDPNDHSGIVIAGNERTGLWKKIFGLADAEAAIKAVRTVIEDPGEGSTTR